MQGEYNNDANQKIRVLIPFFNVGEYIIECVNSLIIQQYDNFEIYLLDDNSTDGTLDLITETSEYIHKIRNNQRLGKIANIHQALSALPFDDHDIIVILNGDDYLFGEYALQLLNAKYNEGIQLTYGQYITNFGILGECSPYTEEEFLNIRKAPWKVSHLKTFKFQLYKTFLKKDPYVRSFKFDDGCFFTEACNIALMIPLIELAGIKKIFCFKNVLCCNRKNPDEVLFTSAKSNNKSDIESCIRNRKSIIRIKPLKDSSTIDVQYQEGKLLYKFNDCFQSRGKNTIKMIKDTLKGKKHLNVDINCVIHTGDFPIEIKKNHFYYCCSRKEDRDQVIPDYAFYRWNEAGIDTFDSETKKIENASKKEPISNKLFWIGNTFMNENRRNLLALGLQHSDKLEIRHTEVDRHIIHNHRVDYVSLPDHCRYKYLLDIEGLGYSGRLKYLLFTNRLLFVQERRWKEYFHFDLVPYKHFIPVKNDLSDLIEKINDVNGDIHLYNSITNNALKFAHDNLNYEKAIEYMRNIFRQVNE